MISTAARRYTVNESCHNPMRRIRRVHFIGIAGAGMNGIAEIMLKLGYQVSGSDIVSNLITQRLSEAGAIIYQGHAANQVAQADVVVVSTAIASDNVELLAAHQQRIPIVPRAEMLSELMRFWQGIAIAGTHGKTTTTSMVASVLLAAGLDPTFVIGGRVNNIGTHAQLGEGDYLVAEADESDGSFLYFQPVIAAITNIDADHLSTYGGDFERLVEAFQEFLHHLPFYGLAVLCVDDPIIRRILPDINRPLLTYGIETPADVFATDIQPFKQGVNFNLHLPNDPQPTPINLQIPGRHNVLNALAAAAIAHELDIPVAITAQALSAFSGVKRRFQIYDLLPITGGTFTLVDDYAHHPTEVRAVIQAARECWPQRRLVVVFQPHRYTRTQELFDDFVAVLSAVDVLCLLEVYPAGEQPIIGVAGRALSRAIRLRGQVEPIFIESEQNLAELLTGLLQPDDVLLMLGAGSIGAMITTVLDQFSTEAVC